MLVSSDRMDECVLNTTKPSLSLESINFTNVFNESFTWLILSPRILPEMSITHIKSTLLFLSAVLGESRFIIMGVFLLKSLSPFKIEMSKEKTGKDKVNRRVR
jgi:hypothetical protein